MKVFLLRDAIGWFGDHSGYEQLSRFLVRDRLISTISIKPSSGAIPRALGKLSSIVLKHGSINQAHAYARLKASACLFGNHKSILHILYGEEHAKYWASFPSSLHASTIITFHQPPAQWTSEAVTSLQWVRNAIFLYQRDLKFFQLAMPNAQIHFIPYGVDVGFFSPVLSIQSGIPKRLLYNGVHLRNVSMLRRIVPSILARHPDVVFDFLVPLHRQDESVFGELLGHPSITWHSGLDDQALLSLYRQSYLMLLPMNDSGANTAVVEALACGVPVVTTDVGGIRDYGGGSIYPVVDNNDDIGMVDIISVYLNDPHSRDQVSSLCRLFAEDRLDWSIVARQHSHLYHQIQSQTV